VRAVGQARAASPALRRGSYVSLKATETFLAYARVYDDQVAIVALNHSPSPITETVALPPGVPLPDGAVLTNALAADEAVTVSGGALVIALPPRSAGIFLP
jgi:O-glycosyl hydrolase